METPANQSDPLTEMKVLSACERYLSLLRPFLTSEGSTMTTKDYKNGVLTILVSGACVGCALGQTDFAQFASEMKQDIPEIREIRFVNAAGLPVL